jgi:hypothetical protein
VDEGAARVLKAFAENGGEVITVGRTVEALAPFRNVAASETPRLTAELARNKGVIKAGKSSVMGIAVHRAAQGTILHVVNYNYNASTHRIDPIDASFDLEFEPRKPRVHSFPESAGVSAVVKGRKLNLARAGIYTILEL